MRRILITALLLWACACKDEDAHRPPSSAPDAGTPSTADAGKKSPDAGQAESGLERPGSLARPPENGLPAELRPPR